MGTKQNPGAFDCYVKAKPDEPMFILLARDPIAPLLVRLWAVIATLPEYHCEISTEKYQEALACADAMETWRLIQMIKRDSTTKDLGNE